MGFLAVTLILSLMGSIFAGRAAAMAADPANSSSARGWAIGATITNSFNLLACLIVAILYFYMRKKQNID